MLVEMKIYRCGIKKLQFIGVCKTFEKHLTTFKNVRPEMYHPTFDNKGTTQPFSKKKVKDRF